MRADGGRSLKRRRLHDSLLETSLLRLTPDSAAWIASRRCTSGGTLTMNFPL